MTAQAIERTTLIRIPGQVILGSIQRSPEFTRRLLAGLSQRLHYLISDVESYCLLSSSQRVAGYLLQELERFHKSTDDMTIRLPASKGAIASRLSLTPETFSRTLHHLVEEGVIDVTGKTIAVRDLESLREHGRSV
ncbi:MAG: Crp/Fnr family transcriptional regulator [Pseudomonadota bacterium]|nr:Crp/Fnr family transcriptional regulator [Pseudomonadota bacterium]